MSREIVLKTPRLTLTTWEDTDTRDMFRLHADPQTMRYIGHGIEDDIAAQKRLQGYLADQQILGWTKWRVQDEHEQAVGRAGFGLFEDRRHRELGYLLKPEFWGQGLATELARALTEWHFLHPDPQLSTELLALAVTENTASLRVLEKVGFHFVEERDYHGRPHTFYTINSATAT